MSKKIKFAVVGVGHIGRRHVSVIQQNTDAELVAVADSDPELERFVLKEYQVPFFCSYEQLLTSDLNIDVINICTPNSFHAPQAIKALNRGVHVVIEKPMALSKTDCEDIIYKSTEVRKLVFCVMQNRYSPPAKWLKGLINSGKLGNVNIVNINCYWNRDDRYYKTSSWRGSKKFDGGTLYTQFSHFIDTLFWLLGDITNIQAKFKNFNHEQVIEFEDTGIVTFDLVKGGSGTINYTTSCWDSNFESSITIIGEKGSVKVGGQYMNKVEYCHVQNYELPDFEESAPPNDYGHYKGSAANHHFVIDNVIDTLLGRSVVATNVVEGMKVVEIIEKIYTNRNR